MTLGYLDLLARNCRTARQTHIDTFNLALDAEAVGLSRYWISEHHSPSVSTSSPELLASAIAQHTKAIRVGIACVLAQYQSSYKLASVAHGLDSITNGRIDFGVGRGNAGPHHADYCRVTANDLDSQPIGFETKVRAMVQILSGLEAGDDREETINREQKLGQNRQLWIMGSGGESMAIARDMGLNYAHSLFFESSAAGFSTSWRDMKWADELKELARARKNNSSAKLAIAVAGCCCKSEREARELVSRRPNRFIVPLIFGTPSHCGDLLRFLGDLFHVSEIIYHDISPDIACQSWAVSALASELSISRNPASATS